MNFLVGDSEVKDNAVCTGRTKPIFEEFAEYEICVATSGTVQGLGCNEGMCRLLWFVYQSRLYF